MEVLLNINNKNVTVNVPADEMLMTTLRNLGYYSVRCGCDTTNCGLCTVWVDDEIREYLIGNLCRCTGYESQLRGVRKYLQGGL